MKRFIDLGNQINEDTREFAFFDTIQDGFDSINGSQTWESRSEFTYDCLTERMGKDELKRYLSLIPKNWK